MIQNIGKKLISSNNLVPVEYIIYNMLRKLHQLIRAIHELIKLPNFRLERFSSPEMAPMFGSLVNIMIKLCVQDLQLSLDFVPDKYIKKKILMVNLI